MQLNPRGSPDYLEAAASPVQSESVSKPNLFFAYSSLLVPARLETVAPGAVFRFAAHYPSTRLKFVKNGGPTIPTLEESPEHIVWGAVFGVTLAELESIARGEKEAGRTDLWEMRAVDRAGTKHECVAFVGPSGAAEVPPEREHLEEVIAGARHWELPAGWVMGLEDLIEDPLFS